MLVRVADGPATSGQQPLVEWMSRWGRPGDPPGVALFNPSLPGSGRCDAVVFTPACSTVIEAEQLTEPLDGQLTIPLNGSWTVNGVPVHLSGVDTRTPLDQSRDRTYTLQTWLVDNDLGQHSVRGLVVLMPSHHTRLHVSHQWNDPAFTVVLGHEAAVREYFAAQLPTPTESLTAADIADIFSALGCSDLLPTPNELAAQGFIGSTTSPGTAANSFTVPDIAPAPTTAGYDPLYSEAEPEQGWTRYSPWALYPYEPGRRNVGRALARLVLTIGMVVAVAWIVWFAIELAAASLP